MELVHKFMRTESSKIISEANFLGMIYIVLKVSPSERSYEQIRDLLLVFNSNGVIDVHDIFRGKDPDGDNGSRANSAEDLLENAHVPKGAIDTYIAVWRAYYKANKTFMEKYGKTVEQMASEYYND